MFDIFPYSLCFVEERNNHHFKLWHMVEQGVKYEGVKLLGNTHQGCIPESGFVGNSESVNPRKGKLSVFGSNKSKTKHSNHSNLLCETNLVRSRFSLVNPEFLSFSSPFSKRSAIKYDARE